MAEQITHDVVKEAQSMGGPVPIDDTAISTNHSAGDGEASSDPTNTTLKHLEPTSTNATNTEAARGDSTIASDKAGGDAAATFAAVAGSQPKAGSATPEPKEHLVNGDSAEQSASEDVSSQQAFGEASGGSDTDISRPGSVDPAKDRTTGHLRSNSVKKPASFKSVSVTKNFLAKSAVSTPAARTGDKVAPGSQNNAPALLTQKPRLVAKSGSGMGNLTRSLAKTNGAGSGPDASKVWNKNQPVPPPPPKQFTDEELKQQYGIHMATRLQADEAGKEAKWADIDDDEDDWAPDTVQWMDGTKSTVAAVENQSPPSEESKPVTPKELATEPVKRAPTPATNSQRPSSTTGTKTILKPGAHVQASSTKSGLVVKGQSDKPTLVAKPSTAVPVKSPWATLPPVDKVSPVQVNAPVQQPPQSRFSQRDAQGYDAILPPPGPAKEIAPDDFNRSWRDDRGNRELFNSHSGRYEPVPEMRRGSVRDNYRQQPSVLQRPSHDGPAEPSAAFQTSRTSADGPAWGRRRNSSNVSGGSGRRMSIDKRAPDLHALPMNVQRRGSQSINGSDAMALGRPAFGPRGALADLHHAVPDQHPPQWAQKTSPNLSQAQPLSPFGSVSSSVIADSPAPSVPAPALVENPVEVQNRLMREKIERAKLLKQKEREAEEKEEAERKERIRKKLEAMGMGDDTKPKLREQSPARSVEKSPQKDKVVPALTQSPPKPPIPTSEGEVAQYGMMKVHQPQPVKKPFHPDLAAPKMARPTEHAPKPSPSPVKVHTDNQPKSASSFTESAPQPQSTFTRDNRKSLSDVVQVPLQQSESETRASLQSIKPAQPPQTAWSTSLPQQSRPWASNVWGPPQAKDRALGNGTFDSGYNRSEPHPGSQQLSSQGQPSQPPPLGLNSPLKPSAPQAQTAPKQPFAQPTMFAQSETLPAQQANAVTKPGPIAPPVDKSWGNFAAAIRHDDQTMVVKARQNFERMGGETFRPEIRETYTDQQGKSQTTLHSKVSGSATLDKNSVKPELSQAAPSELRSKDGVPKPAYSSSVPENDVSAPHGQGAHLQSAGQGARASRFFPRHPEASNQSLSVSSKSDSPPPPPPETESHPAFTGDSEHPIVRMPKPSPRVRLPPAAIEPSVVPEAPVSMPSRVRLGLGARPLALDPEWQARFNSLLEKSPPAVAPVPTSKHLPVNHHVAHTKPGAFAIAASTKAPLDVRASIVSATVSLPNTASRKTFIVDNSSEVTTCISAEEALLEDREFGSLPVVKPPKVPHLAASEPPVGFPPSRPNSKFQRFNWSSSKESLDFLDFENSTDSIEIRVRLEHMRDAVTKSMARKRDHRKGPGYKGPKRNFTQNRETSGSGSQRQRKPSNHQGQGTNSTTSPRTSGGSGWNRSAPPQHNNNNNTWARRAAPVH